MMRWWHRIQGKLFLGKFKWILGEVSRGKMEYRVGTFYFTLFFHFVMYAFYGCEDFTHFFGREEKSRVKGLVGLENLFENRRVWALLYAIIIHILLGEQGSNRVSFQSYKCIHHITTLKIPSQGYFIMVHLWNHEGLLLKWRKTISNNIYNKQFAFPFRAFTNQKKSCTFGAFTNILQTHYHQL